MFEPFGITARQVNATLAACRDRSHAFNTFESLKTRVQMRWSDMVGGDISPERIDELRPAYERLMKIRLTNYTPQRSTKSTVVDLFGSWLK